MDTLRHVHAVLRAGAGNDRAVVLLVARIVVIIPVVGLGLGCFQALQP